MFKAYGERLDELQKDGLNIEFIGALHGNGTPGVWSDRGIFWTATIWHPNIVEKVFGSHKKREMVEFFEHGHFNVTCDNDIYLCPIRCVR